MSEEESKVDPLEALRYGATNKTGIDLLTDRETGQVTEDIEKAQYLRLTVPKQWVPDVDNDGLNTAIVTIPLSVKTRFHKPGNEGIAVDLRAVYFCWQQRNSNVAEYISLCSEKDVEHLTFLEKTSLVTWLESAANECEFIVPMERKQQGDQMEGKGAEKGGGSTSELNNTTDSKGNKVSSGQRRLVVKRTFDPRLKSIYARERTLSDHNTVLHGMKPSDFTYVRKEAYDTFISRLRSKSGSSQHQKVSAPVKQKYRDPIILLSPSASALLNMSNAKEFLDGGVFTMPSSASSNQGANLQSITRNSPRLGGNIRFILIDSTDLFKPDYWDRVVAVFTTGQTWQFRSYKWSDPNLLFQKVKGFCVAFSGDAVPSNVQGWNVEPIIIDRNRRFRDREVVERVWEHLEKWMAPRGWTGRKT